MGAKTSSIFFKRLLLAQLQLVDKEFMMLNMVLLNGVTKNGYNKPEVVYGDTDSVFVKFSKSGHIMKQIELTGKEALQYCIDCGVKAGEWITEHKMNPEWDTESCGKGPQDLEYEKTFYPFILISKKIYWR